jgi:hypothetical protein
LDQAHDALERIGSEVKGVEAKLNMLATRKLSREAMGTILDRLFPQRKDSDGKPLDSTRRDNILSDVLRCYESNDHNAFPEQRGTPYNLLNAITEYTDHVRSTRKDDKGESAMFGSGNRLKMQAMEVLLESASGLPPVSRTVYVPAAAPTTGSLLDQVLAEHSR